MGCSNSAENKESGDEGQKSHKFTERLNRREPLAMAIRLSFDNFLRECEEYSKGRRQKVEYPNEVDVIDNLEDANKAKLTYDVAKSTASDFLGYAMDCLGKRNWGGNVHSNLHGAEGRLAELKLNGKVEFDDDDENTIEEPYNVVFKFFCAKEDE